MGSEGARAPERDTGLSRLLLLLLLLLLRLLLLLPPLLLLWAETECVPGRKDVFFPSRLCECVFLLPLCLLRRGGVLAPHAGRRDIGELFLSGLPLRLRLRLRLLVVLRRREGSIGGEETRGTITADGRAEALAVAAGTRVGDTSLTACGARLLFVFAFAFVVFFFFTAAVGLARRRRRCLFGDTSLPLGNVSNVPPPKVAGVDASHAGFGGDSERALSSRSGD